MIRLGSSQILLANRDVTRTLSSNRPGRQPNSLRIKGNRINPQVPQLNTSRPPSSSTPRSVYLDGIQNTSFIAPSSSPIWSGASDTDSDNTTLSSMPDLLAMNPRTDGTSDASLTSSSIDEEDSLDQLVPLDTVDSFPFLPPDREQPQNPWRIYEDPESESDSDDSTSNNESDDVFDNGEDYEITPNILTEAPWGPNTILVTDDERTPSPQQIPPQLQQGRIDLGGRGGQGGLAANLTLFETPPRAR